MLINMIKDIVNDINVNSKLMIGILNTLYIIASNILRLSIFSNFVIYTTKESELTLSLILSLILKL